MQNIVVNHCKLRTIWRKTNFISWTLIAPGPVAEFAWGGYPYLVKILMSKRVSRPQNGVCERFFIKFGVWIAYIHRHDIPWHQKMIHARRLRFGTLLPILFTTKHEEITFWQWKTQNICEKLGYIPCHLLRRQSLQRHPGPWPSFHLPGTKLKNEHDAEILKTVSKSEGNDVKTKRIASKLI